MSAFAKTHTNKINYKKHIGIIFSNSDRCDGNSNLKTKNKSSSEFQK
jgi:hypothetical protein